MEGNKVKFFHQPVLVEEVLDYLKVDKIALSKKARIIDATVGAAGHSAEFVKREISVLGIDADKDSLEIAGEVLERACPDGHQLVPVSSPNQTRGLYTLVHGNFKDIKKIASDKDFYPVDGFLFDLGLASYQITSPDRGISFAEPGAELDMRLDRENQSVKASDLLNSLPEKKLVSLFSEVLDYRNSVKIANQIVKARKVKIFKTVSDLLSVLSKTKIGHKKTLSPETLPFLALRIAVNSELENLEKAIPQSFDLLKKGGRLAVISFHSGEDRLVKHIFKNLASIGIGKILTKKPIKPKLEEIIENPRSRSAKLRVIEKLS